MLTFLGLKDDIKVPELMPGGTGWYTKILGLVLEEKGKLCLSIGTNSAGTMIEEKPGFSTTGVLSFNGLT